MKRILLFLLLGLGLGSGAHVLYYSLRQPPVYDARGGELAWLKAELQLTDAQFARISELHEASNPRLRSLAAQIAELQKEFVAFETARRTTDTVDFIEFARFVEARRNVSRERLDSLRQLVSATANVMTPAQRERYLGLVRAPEPMGSPTLLN